MTLELLIHSIVRQTTILIAQLATSTGSRAPLAQIADQVFLDLVRELERQGVSRRVSADMFGLGLRTYQRKIQRLSESRTERGRSLWEVVLEFVRDQVMVTRGKVLLRFASDDESQVRSVLHDLSESRLIFSSGTGTATVYRAASDAELRALHQMRPEEGLDELIWVLVYRLGPASREELLGDLEFVSDDFDQAVSRLVQAGRVECLEVDGRNVYRSSQLFIALDAPSGWEAAVFDHYKAMVNTIAARLGTEAAGGVDAAVVGGSTYTLDIWEGHPLAEEVKATLARLRKILSEQRTRVEDYNAKHGLPTDYNRVIQYVGQCLIGETAQEHDVLESE
jgi:hypothetical protein